MKIWSTGKVAEKKEQAAASRISKIKNRIFQINQLNAGGQDSFESWKVPRLAGGGKRKVEEGIDVDSNGSK